MDTATLTPESELIGLLYESVLDTRAWTSFFNRMVELLNLRSACLSTVNISTGEVCSYFEGGEGISTYYRQIYAEKYAHDDGLSMMALQNPPGQLIYLQDLPPEMLHSMTNTSFFHDWVVPQGIHQTITCNVRVEGPWRTMLMIHRNHLQGDFLDFEKRIFDRLLPHLQRASQLHMRLAEAGQNHQDTNEILERFTYGVAIVDDQAFICNTNALARGLLQEHPDLSIQHQRLVLANTAVSRRLNFSILEAVRASVGLQGDSTAVFTLPRDNGEKLMILVTPFSTRDTQQRQRAMLLFYEPGKHRTSNPEMVSALWGLSPAETALVCALVEGNSLEECVGILHRSKETLRSYLKNVFVKTGTNRQSDLIAMVLTSPAVMQAG